MKCSVRLAILLEITANLYVHRREIRHSKRGQARRQRRQQAAQAAQADSAGNTVRASIEIGRKSAVEAVGRRRRRRRAPRR